MASLNVSFVMHFQWHLLLLIDGLGDVLFHSGRHLIVQLITGGGCREDGLLSGSILTQGSDVIDAGTHSTHLALQNVLVCLYLGLQCLCVFVLVSADFDNL